MGKFENYYPQAGKSAEEQKKALEKMIERDHEEALEHDKTMESTPEGDAANPDTWAVVPKETTVEVTDLRSTNEDPSFSGPEKRAANEGDVWEDAAMTAEDRKAKYKDA